MDLNFEIKRLSFWGKLTPAVDQSRWLGELKVTKTDCSVSPYHLHFGPRPTSFIGQNIRTASWPVNITDQLIHKWIYMNIQEKRELSSQQ
jgi:hypothetical protein